MTTSETRQAKKGLPFKDITVEPGDTFWPRMERLMVKYDIDTANVEYASLRETSDQEWASKLYVQYGIGGRFSGIEARVDAGPFFGDLATPPAPSVTVFCDCGNTEAEHGKPGCLYECCTGFRPALDALRATAQPHPDAAGKGEHVHSYCPTCLCGATAEVAEVLAERDALREALEAAARSLEALSRCGTASNMTDLLDVRGYASSRARIARAALLGPEET